MHDVEVPHCGVKSEAALACQVFAPSLDGDPVQQSEVNEICPLRGGVSNPPRLSIREVLLNVVCAAVLLAILVPVVWFAEQWLERASQRTVDRMIWREPIETWNQ